jgi:hypothetical protein
MRHHPQQVGEPRPLTAQDLTAVEARLMWRLKWIIFGIQVLASLGIALLWMLIRFFQLAGAWPLS